ncbi:MAG: MATE family efflux transporter [Xanthomonadales bacterium]
MRFRPTYGNIWGVTWPLILAGISETVIDVTDTIFLAYYGTAELAAIGVADSVYGLSLFLIIGLVEATQILIGRRSGEARPAQVGDVLNHGLALLMLASLLMIPLILGLVPVALNDLLTAPSIADDAFSYLRVAVFGLVFQAFNLALSAFFIGISRTRVLIGAALVLSATNIALDWLLIFGHAGFPELGIGGAARATLTAEIATSGFLLGYVLRRGYVSRFGLFRLRGWDIRLAAKLALIGLPVSLNALVDMAKWFLLIVIIERLGERTLASANIVLSCYTLFLIPVDNFSETICTMVSNLIGQNHLRKLRLLLGRTMRLAYAVILPLLMLAVLFPEPLLGLFTPDRALAAASVGGLLAITLATVLAVPADTWFSAVLGTGDTRASFAIQLTATVGAVLWAWLIARHTTLGLGVILLGETIAWSICLIASAWWFRGRRWQRLAL